MLHTWLYRPLILSALHISLQLLVVIHAYGVV